MKRCKLKRASMGSLPGPVVYFRDMHSVLCLYHIGHHVEERSSCTFNVNRIALNKWSTFLLLILWNWKMKTYHTRKNGGSMVFNATFNDISVISWRGKKLEAKCKNKMIKKMPHCKNSLKI